MLAVGELVKPCVGMMSARLFGHDTARFTKLKRAQDFAKGKFLYGQPATVDTDSDVPAKLFARWMREGKIVQG